MHRLTLLLVLGACAPPAADPPKRTDPHAPLPQALVGAPELPGPAPRHRAFEAATVNATCVDCHVDIANEWRVSLHREAHTNAPFQRQFAEEPFAFCTGCHAPEAVPTEPVPTALSHLGVGCVTCHVVGGRLVTAFAGSDGCAGCHQFAFPKGMGPSDLLMQATIDEHRASAHAAQSCASCHMPLVDGAVDGRHRSHRFAASRDAAMVRSAVVVEAAWDDHSLTLRLAPGAVGHAFPTGDMLRRLAVAIEVRDAEGRTVDRHERFLARHFGFERRPNKPLRRIERKDDRVGVNGRAVTIEHHVKSPPQGGTIHYTVHYQRVLDPNGPILDGSVLVAQETMVIR